MFNWCRTHEWWWSQWTVYTNVYCSVSVEHMNDDGHDELYIL